MNWRKPLIYTLLYLSGSKIPIYLDQIRRFDKRTVEDQKKIQRAKLAKILAHAWKNVPYYGKILEECGVVKDGKLFLENFEKIPVLTKDIIRKEGKDLYSKDHKERRSYENTSGGSTGEPVKFIQDKHYEEWNVSNKLFYFGKIGKEIGRPEIKLWGSDRDVLEGTLGATEKIKNLIYNRYFLNTFNITPEKFSGYLEKINQIKPQMILAYYDSLFELAVYANKNNLKMFSPDLIVTTIGKLTEGMFTEIKKAFPGSKIYDQYGSREVGAIAVEFKECSFLNAFPLTHYIETSPSEGEGRILVTTLENFSMPLIRYEIGDMGILKEPFTLEKVTGRIFSHFEKKDGTLIHAQFFVILMFNRNWVGKFRFVQKDYDHIQIIIEKTGEIPDEEKIEIEDKIHKVFGECRIEWKIVDRINPTESGKYLYTVNELHEIKG